MQLLARGLVVALIVTAGCSGQATDDCRPVPYPQASSHASGGAGVCAELVVVDDIAYAPGAFSLDVSLDELVGAGTVEETNISGMLVDGAVYALPGVEVSQALAVEVWRGGAPELVILWGPEADRAFPALCEYIPTRAECLASLSA